MEEEEKIFFPEHYETKFDPYAYLTHYYSRKALDDGTRLSLFALPTFARIIEREMREDERQSLIDIGAGPTVYTAICFRDVVKRVCLTDFLQKNLDILNDWLDRKRTFDWSPLIRIVCRMEGECLVNGDEVHDIEEQARSLVTAGGIYHADVTTSPCCQRERLPIQQFDILVSVFCLESACTNYESYCQAMANMLELLRPGGRLIIGSVLDEDRYVSGKSTVFSLLALSEEEIRLAAEKNDIDMQSARKFVLEDDGVMFFIATKNQH
ncbi:unnamed protein product [Toxocara canis]|uniref:Putative methyltransferase B0303.2 n=1 Tax=Toxocara canis TaxID=6265 RepID=A0A183UZB7_TOXCA|nr:unnamed protein product [Toxocara canis]